MSLLNLTIDNNLLIAYQNYNEQLKEIFSQMEKLQVIISSLQDNANFNTSATQGEKTKIEETKNRVDTFLVQTLSNPV